MFNNKLLMLLLIIPVISILLLVFRNDNEVIEHMESLAIFVATMTFGLGLILGAKTQQNKKVE